MFCNIKMKFSHIFATIPNKSYLTDYMPLKFNIVNIYYYIFIKKSIFFSKSLDYMF